MKFNVDLLDTDYRDENLLRAFDNSDLDTFSSFINFKILSPVFIDPP